MELTNVEKQEKSIVALTIAVSKEELEIGKNKAFQKNKNRITVPGFRKGKAPRALIEQMYGEGVFLEDAINAVYPDALEAAIKEADLKQVGPADVELKDVPEKEGFVFVASVPVEPEVKLGDYKGLEADKTEAKVFVKDIDQELERMAKRVARTETAEREARMGDTVDMDFAGAIDGVPFEGGSGENYKLTLGSGSFIPGFEEQLVGVKAGEEKDVTVTFPENYHAEELKSKQAVFHCTVHSVLETVLPEMDDEFAKDVSETCETLEDLKREINDRVLKQREEQADQAFEEALLDKVLEGFEADIPDIMVESQIDTIVQDFSYRLQMQGMRLEQYLQGSNMQLADFRNMFREQALRQVKVRLSLQKIAADENIEVSDDEMNEEFGKMAEGYKMEEKEVRKFVKEDALRGDLKLTKALDIIKDSAKVTLKPAEEVTVTEVGSTDDMIAQ